MNSFTNDYSKLYKLQDKFLTWWRTLGIPFYLTGGTALGRFYLNHRYSEDLDFFTNNDPNYQAHLKQFKSRLGEVFEIDTQNTLYTEDYTRLFIHDKTPSSQPDPPALLKIELVNDVEYRFGKPLPYQYGLIDTPANILANKLTTIVGRDEPKDVFDIVQIARSYSFTWDTIFNDAKQKTIINEIDVEERLYSFPLEWLDHVNWIPAHATFDHNDFLSSLHQIADDFLLGKPNSLGKNQPAIEEARPLVLA